MSLAVDRNGYTYVGLIPGDTHGTIDVGVYGPTAQGENALLRSLNIPQNDYRPTVGVDGAGDVYVAEPLYPTAAMTKYAPFAAGNVLLSSYCVGPYCISNNDFLATSGLAVSPLSGKVYVLNDGVGGQSITIFNPAFTRIIGSIPGSAVGTGILAPGGIDIDGMDNFYLLIPGVNGVEVLAVVGNKVVSSRAIAGPDTGINRPVAITFIDSN